MKVGETMVTDNYERIATLVVSVMLILGDVVLHALRLSDTFTDDLALVAAGALYMGTPYLLKHVSGGRSE